MNQRARARKVGSASHSDALNRTDAKIGRSPTMERARTTIVVPSGFLNRS